MAGPTRSSEGREAAGSGSADAPAVPEDASPLDALVFSPKAKYIYIGRDGRDVVWSMYNHHVNSNETWLDRLSDASGRVVQRLIPGLVRVDVVVVHTPHDVAPVASDVDVLRLR